MKKRYKRMILIFVILLTASLALYFIVKAFNSNLMYFYTPTDIISNPTADGKVFKIGGMVKEGSVKRSGVDVNFIISDNDNEMKIFYSGILPDLFKEGQGIVASGYLENNVFVATEVLAKHDENYMPPELADALLEQ